MIEIRISDTQIESGNEVVIRVWGENNATVHIEDRRGKCVPGVVSIDARDIARALRVIT